MLKPRPAPVPALLRPMAGLLAALVLCVAAGLGAGGGARASAVPLAAAAAPSLVFAVGSHTGPIRRLAVSPDGKLAVTASDDKTAIVWSIDSGKPLNTLRVPVGEDAVGRLYGAAITADGRSVAIAAASGAPGGADRIHIFDLESGLHRNSIDARGDGIRQLAWSADGSVLVAVHAGRPALRAFRADGRLLGEVVLAADAYGLSIARDGHVAVASFDGRVRIFRLAAAGPEFEGEIATSLADPVSVRYSPSGEELAVGYYSRGPGGRVMVDVYAVRGRSLLRSFEFADIGAGNLMNVAWQADGRALYAGGTGYNEPGRFLVRRIAWPAGNVATVAVAEDSILDLAALPDGRMAFASFDSTWGVLDGLNLRARSDSPIGRVVSATALKASVDATTIALEDASHDTRSFSLLARRAGHGEAAAERGGAAAGSGLRSGDWQNTRTPRIDGHPIQLLPAEVSRAAVAFPDGRSILLGTSRGLRRVARDGSALWMLPMHTEVRAVTLSADARIVVAALSDGTVRWRRATDGAALLSLLLLRDGRWVLWTESGYYDASAGAEDLVGWLVARADGQQVDYFGASRFRERYLRPDVIDQVLGQLDAPRAVVVADALRLARAQAEGQAEALQVLRVAQPQPPLEESLPAVVTLLKPQRIDTAASEVAIDFRLYEHGPSSAAKITARIDGRPVPVTVKQVAAAGGREAEGRMIVPLSKAEGRIQVFAEGLHGVSMPAEVEFRSTAPALAAADRRPALYVLAVGVSRYANPEFSLGLAAKDARDFARSLEGQDKRLYRKIETRLLLDEGATRGAVLQGLRWLQSAPTANDIAVLFIAGHGVSDAADVYHFLPYDMNEAQVAQTGVSETQLRSVLSAVKGRAVFFVDTCFSGKSVGRFSRRELGRMANTLASPELGVIVFSASAPRQESLEDSGWGNGAFTKALVEGLSGKADFRNEGLITHKGLDYYVAHAVRELTAGRQTPVTAVPNGISDFPLAALAALPVNKTKE